MGEQQLSRKAGKTEPETLAGAVHNARVKLITVGVTNIKPDQHKTNSQPLRSWLFYLQHKQVFLVSWYYKALAWSDKVRVVAYLVFIGIVYFCPLVGTAVVLLSDL
ncbi:hypothetical protein POKO110462_09690 [Pontibacter korlensis]